MSNFMFGYLWHVLAAFGMNRTGCQAEIRQHAHVIGKADWGFLTPAFAADIVFIDWIY
jgi:hypothetical protein